jgi:hypothetical protein
LHAELEVFYRPLIAQDTAEWARCKTQQWPQDSASCSLEREKERQLARRIVVAGAGKPMAASYAASGYLGETDSMPCLTPAGLSLCPCRQLGAREGADWPAPSASAPLPPFSTATHPFVPQASIRRTPTAEQPTHGARDHGQNSSELDDELALTFTQPLVDASHFRSPHLRSTISIFRSVDTTHLGPDRRL